MHVLQQRQPVTNMNFRVRDNKLTIEIDLTQENGVTMKTGNISVAGTANWVQLAPGWNFNCVLTRKPDAKMLEETR